MKKMKKSTIILICGIIFSMLLIVAAGWITSYHLEEDLKELKEQQEQQD